VAADTRSPTGSSISSATRPGSPAGSCRHRIRSEPQCAYRAAALRGRREALHPGSGWFGSRSQSDVGSGR
jgi:hypothetical protein